MVVATGNFKKPSKRYLPFPNVDDQTPLAVSRHPHIFASSLKFIVGMIMSRSYMKMGKSVSSRLLITTADRMMGPLIVKMKSLLDISLCVGP
jgi:hypothetical protein